MSVDTIEHRAYVFTEAGNVSVIDIYTNGIVENITLADGVGPIEFNPLTRTLFATDYFNNTVIAIDERGNVTSTIAVGKAPSDITLNPISNLIFAANSLSDTITLINGTSNQKIKDYPISFASNFMYVNPITNNLYLVSSDSDSVGIINGTTNVFEDSVKVGDNPKALAVDLVHNKVYVANSDSDTISVLDGQTNRLLLGLNLHPIPSDEGSIYCADLQDVSDTTHLKWQKTPLNYSLYPVGVEYQCKAESKTQTELMNKFGIFGNFLWELHKSVLGGYTFTSWSGDISPNLTSAVVKFNATKFGATLTANFENVPPAFPVEYRNILVGLAIPAAAGWFYKKREWFFRKKRRESLERYLKIIDAANHTYSINRDKDEYRSTLKNLRLQITDLYGKGSLKETDYLNLNNKILEYEKQTHRST
jgi:YVTN family beta-propeller protein